MPLLDPMVGCMPQVGLPAVIAELERAVLAAASPYSAAMAAAPCDRGQHRASPGPEPAGAAPEAAAAAHAEPAAGCGSAWAGLHPWHASCLDAYVLLSTCYSLDARAAAAPAAGAAGASGSSPAEASGLPRSSSASWGSQQASWAAAVTYMLLRACAVEQLLFAGACACMARPCAGSTAETLTATPSPCLRAWRRRDRAGAGGRPVLG
jgi:hypothetical protein